MNIFLRQFRIGHDQLIQFIRDGDTESLGPEKLRGLLKVLPESDEVKHANHLYL